jgi:hypothetical protein
MGDLNVVLAYGDYDWSDRNVIENILNDIWYLSPGPGVTMNWLPPHRTIIQDHARFPDYDEFVTFIVARMIRMDGDAVLILPKKMAGDHIDILSPIYINHPMRKHQLAKRGVTLRNIRKNNNR